MALAVKWRVPIWLAMSPTVFILELSHTFGAALLGDVPRFHTTTQTHRAHDGTVSLGLRPRGAGSPKPPSPTAGKQWERGPGDTD